MHFGQKKTGPLQTCHFSGWVFVRTIGLAGFEPAHTSTKN